MALRRLNLHRGASLYVCSYSLVQAQARAGQVSFMS